MTRPMLEPPGALMKKILPYRLRRALRVHGPRRNRLPMAVVSLNDGTPDPRAWCSLTAYQLLGGRGWSLSVIRRGPLQVSGLREGSD